VLCNTTKLMRGDETVCTSTSRERKLCRNVEHQMHFLGKIQQLAHALCSTAETLARFDTRHVQSNSNCTSLVSFACPACSEILLMRAALQTAMYILTLLLPGHARLDICRLVSHVRRMARADLNDPVLYGFNHLHLLIWAQYILMQLQSYRAEGLVMQHAHQDNLHKHNL